jgi:hypothetical protein
MNALRGVRDHLERDLRIADDEVWRLAEAVEERAVLAFLDDGACGVRVERVRIVCTCGRISLPFGACKSIGTMRTARGIPFPAGRRSRVCAAARESPPDNRRSGVSSTRPRSPRAAFPLGAAGRAGRRGGRRGAGEDPLGLFLMRESHSGSGLAISVLLTATTRGMFFSRADSAIPSSYSVHTPASRTRTATSAVASADLVRETRSEPISVESSMPAVSRRVIGPRGRSSIDFSTTSVVVPATGLTIEVS